MNKNSPFSTLSNEDRARIIAWCGNHTYEHAVELAARPRPEGLDFKTSVSALQRFYAQYNPRTEDTIISKQLADVLKTQHLEDPETFRAAALALVEQAIFRSLAEGAALKDLWKDFRILFGLHRLRIQDRKERLAEKQNPVVTPGELVSLGARITGNPAAATASEPRPVHTPPPPAQPVRPAPPAGIHIPASVTNSLFDLEPVPHLPSFLGPKAGKITPFPGKNPCNPAFPAIPASLLAQVSEALGESR